jgi:hypothetical protein
LDHPLHHQPSTKQSTTTTTTKATDKTNHKSFLQLVYLASAKNATSFLVKKL